MLVGFGYDVHRLAEGRRLVLAGVEIPHPTGLLGHSDADVICHALMDALLGAAGLRDIGYYFSDSDQRYHGADSVALLRHVVSLLADEGLRPVNVDTTLLAERPKIAPHIEQMRSNLAQALGVAPRRVGIKATTNEGMGFVGRGEGMAAYAVATVDAISA